MVEIAKINGDKRVSSLLKYVSIIGIMILFLLITSVNANVPVAYFYMNGSTNYEQPVFEVTPTFIVTPVPTQIVVDTIIPVATATPTPVNDTLVPVIPDPAPTMISSTDSSSASRGSTYAYNPTLIVHGSGGSYTRTVTPTPVPTKTPTQTVTQANTPVPTPTATPTPVPTKAVVQVVTPVNTPVPTPTSTATPTATPTPVPIKAVVQVVTPVNTPVPTPTSTATPTATPTPVPTKAVVQVVTPVPTPVVQVVTPVPTPAVSSDPNSVYGVAGYTGTDPIGGGAGYSDIKTTGTYIVTTLDQFRSHMVGGSQPATSGQVVFIPSGTTIVFPAGNTPAIPAGVTIASDRGYNGNAGAVLKKSASSGGWSDRMLDIGGNNVRVTGLQLEGEMFPSTSSPVVSEGNYLEGIKNYGGYTGEIVDNNELRGWAYSAIEVKGVPTAGRPWIHNNYIHNNQARGEGYGIEVYGGDALVEANTFNYNRHDITGTGIPGEQYEFRYNTILGGSDNPIGGVHVDVHESLNYAISGAPGYGVACAGTKFLIHHNTVIQGTGTSQEAFVHIRDVPQTGAYVYNNDIQTNWGSASNYDGAQSVIYQSYSETKTISTYNLFVTDNKWKGTVYATNSGIVWEQGYG